MIRHRQVGVGWSRPRLVGRLPLVLWLTGGWSAVELCGLGCMHVVGGVWLGQFCRENGVVIVLREGRAVGVIFSRHVVGSHRLCRETTLACRGVCCGGSVVLSVERGFWGVAGGAIVLPVSVPWGLVAPPLSISH